MPDTDEVHAAAVEMLNHEVEIINASIVFVWRDGFTKASSIPRYTSELPL